LGWKSEANKIYEERVVEDSLARLSERTDLSKLPLSKEELRTLAKRARESFRSPDRKKARLERYQNHLCGIYGTEIVRTLSSALEEINNAIGYEEK
jgi:hypothetical protein